MVRALHKIKKLFCFCEKSHDKQTGQCKNCSAGLIVMLQIFAY